MDEAARQIPVARARRPGAPPEQHAARRVEAHCLRARLGVRVHAQAARIAVHVVVRSFQLGSAARAILPSIDESHGEGIVSDQPEATEREQEEAAEGRQQEQESMAGAGHEDPEDVPEDGEQ